MRFGRYGIPAVVGLIAGIAVVMAMTVADRAPSPEPRSVDDRRATHDSSGRYDNLAHGLGVVGPTEPCSPAVHNAPETLARQASMSIWLPDQTFELTDSWSCGKGSAPVLIFDDVQVSYESGWGHLDTDRLWGTYIVADGGEITGLAGHSALVHTATRKAPNNEIMLVEEDTLVRVLSLGEVPIERLEAIADSLNFENPVQP